MDVRKEGYSEARRRVIGLWLFIALTVLASRGLALPNADMGCWNAYRNCVINNSGIDPIYVFNPMTPCMVDCFDNVYKPCLRSKMPWWRFPVFSNVGTAEAQIAISPDLLAQGYDVKVCWFDSTFTPQPYPTTVICVTFYAALASEVDSLWAVDSSTVAANWINLGHGVGDPLPAPGFGEQVSAQGGCYGYSVTLPNVFSVDTPYYLLADVRDSAVPPDSTIAVVAAFMVSSSVVPML